MNSEILRRLAALKLPTEAFQEVLSIIADLQSADENRRERSRQRTSRWRHGNATVTSLERHNERHSPPRTYTTPPSSESKKILKSVSIPENFSPDLSFATERGWPIEDAKAEVQRFRDHALARGRKYKDWSAAWRNWVTSPYQQKGTANGKHGGSIAAAADRLIAAAEAEEGGASARENYDLDL
jgi:hypothetical protein